MSALKINNDYRLDGSNTFGLPSVARQYVQLDEFSHFTELMQSGLLRHSPFFILGGGSNVVLPEHYDGVIVHPANKGVRVIEDDGDCGIVEVAAGEKWADLVDYCIAQGLYGLENMAGIPGCVGASPVQNVGAYGSEAKDVIEKVHYFDIQTGNEGWIDNTNCQFSYRWSIFKGELRNRCLIDKVRFRLHRQFTPKLGYKALSDALTQRGIDNPTAQDVADTVTTVRDSKLPNPLHIGSAGSFFKNPVVTEDKYNALKDSNPTLVSFPAGDSMFKLSAGWMIEKCGWKGRRLGNAGVYEKQALVLVNLGGATAEDVKNLANAVIDDVEKKFGVRLECEAIFVG